LLNNKNRYNTHNTYQDNVFLFYYVQNGNCMLKWSGQWQQEKRVLSLGLKLLSYQCHREGRGRREERPFSCLPPPVCVLSSSRREKEKEERREEERREGGSKCVIYLIHCHNHIMTIRQRQAKNENAFNGIRTARSSSHYII